MKVQVSIEGLGRKIVARATSDGTRFTRAQEVALSWFGKEEGTNHVSLANHGRKSWHWELRIHDEGHESLSEKEATVLLRTIERLRAYGLEVELR